MTGARTCPSCGEQFTTRWAKRKLCATCQVLRDMAYREWERDCSVCGKHFYPIRSSWKACPDCSVFDTNPAGNPECNLCHQRRRTAPGVEATCVFCVQSDVAVRKRYLATLRQIVTRNRRQNGITA